MKAVGNSDSAGCHSHFDFECEQRASPDQDIYLAMFSELY